MAGVSAGEREEWDKWTNESQKDWSLWKAKRREGIGASDGIFIVSILRMRPSILGLLKCSLFSRNMAALLP